MYENPSWHGWPPQIYDGKKWVYVKENEMATPALPDYLKNRPGPRLTDRLGDSLGMGAPPSVSITGGRFTLVDTAGSEQPVTTAANGVPYLDAVVIDSLERISKIYYDHSYDPSQPGGPPTCFSDNGIAPSRNASHPQSSTCASCEKGAWGSATSRVTGKGIKACSDYQKLALMVPGLDGIYLLRVPPNTLRNMREYNAKFKGSEFDVSDVVTRISFEKDVLGTLTFAAVSMIDQGIAQHRNEALAKKVTDQLVGRTDQPIQGAIAHSQHTEYAPGWGSMSVAPGPAPQQEARPLPEPAPSAGSPPLPTVAAPTPAAITGPTGNGRRRGRPRATEATPQAVQAPFPTQSNPVPAQPSQGAPFGIGQGQAPDAGLNAALDNFFGPGKG
jgi:hypothetical protein